MHSEIARPQSDEILSPEELVYLFPNEFLEIAWEPASSGPSKAHFFFKPAKADKEVTRAVLAQMMYIAAFVWLASSRVISIHLRQDGFLFFSSKATFVDILRHPLLPLPGLRGEILDIAQAYQGNKTVRDIVYRSLGQPHSAPWEEIIHITELSLSEHGLLLQELRTPQIKQGVDSYSAAAESLRKLVKDFKESRQTIYQQLWRDVARGIASRSYAWYT